MVVSGPTCRSIADRIAVEDALSPLPPLAWHPSAAAPAPAALEPLARAEVDHALSLVRRIHEDVAAIGGVVDSLATDGDPAPTVAPSGAADSGVSRWPARIDALRGSLDRDSAVLRHAVRVALVVLAAMAATRALHLERAYWATLTAVLLLQPYLPATLTRGLQRVGGHDPRRPDRGRDHRDRPRSARYRDRRDRVRRDQRRRAPAQLRPVRARAGWPPR